MAEKIGEAYIEATIRLGKLRSGLRQAERMVTSSVAKMQRSLNTLSARVGMSGMSGIAGRGAGGLLGAGVAGGVAGGLMGAARRIAPMLDKAINDHKKYLSDLTRLTIKASGETGSLLTGMWGDIRAQVQQNLTMTVSSIGQLEKATNKYGKSLQNIERMQVRVHQRGFRSRRKSGVWGSWDPKGPGGSAGRVGVADEGPFGPTMWNKAQKAAKTFYKENKVELKRMGQTSGTVYRSMQAFYKRGIKDTSEIRANLEKVFLHKSEQRGSGFYSREPGEAMGAARFGFDDPESFKRSKKMARAAARQREQDALRDKRVKAEWKALQKQYQSERMASKSSKQSRKIVDKTTRVIKARADLRKRQEVIEHLKAVKDWKIAATRRKLAAKDLFERRPGLFPKGVSTEQKPWVVDRRRKEANRWEKERRLSELMNAQKALKQQKAIWDKQATARKKFNKLDLPSGMGAARYDAYDALKGRPQYKPTAPSWQKPGVIPGAPGRLKALQQYGKAMKEIHELERRAAKPVGYIRGMGKALHQMPKDFGSFLAVGKKAMRGIKIAAGGMWGSFKKIGSGFGGWFKKIKAGFFGSTSGAQEFLKKLGMLKGIGIAALGAIARQTLISAMRFEAMRGSLDGLAGSAENAKNILYHMNRGLRGTVAAVDLVQQANSALLLGLPASAEKMGQLATISRRLSRAMGIDVKHGFASFVTGIGRQSRMLLDNLGIIVDTNQAYTIYAKKLGKAASQLTEVEKKQAFFNAALEAGAMRVEKMGEDVAYNIGTFEKLGATSKDAGLSLAGLVLQYGPLFWMMKRVDDGSQKMRTSLYRANNEIDRSSGVITKHLAELGRLNKKTAEYIMLLAQQRKWQAEIRKEHEALKVTQHEGRIRAIDRETQRLQTRFDSIARVQDERDRAITAYYDNYFRRLGERLEREKVIEERLADIYVRAAQRKLEKEKEFRSMIESEQEKHLKNTGKNKQAEYLVIKRHYDKLAKEHRNNKKVLQTIEEWRQAAIRNMFKKKEKAFQSEMLGPTGLWEKAMTISLSESEQKTMVKLNESQLSELVLIKAGIDSLISQGKDLDLDE
jgi:hypothetical protein